MLKYLRKHILLFLLFIGIGVSVNSQVNLTATAGTLTGTYTTLGAAFAAINAGTHMGVINISISANTTETGPCTLHSSGAGSAVYNSVNISPAGDNIVVTGATATGRGLIEFNGADTVTINGDNPLTPGNNKNLTLRNTGAVNYISVIRVAMNTTTVNSANNLTFTNLNIDGGVLGRNVSGMTSTTATENSSYGILVTGAANAATSAPTAISSVTTTIGSGASAVNLLITNNSITNAARGICVQGSNAAVFTGLVIDGNIIGNPVIGAPDGIYSIGISAQGSTNAIIKNNVVYVEGYVASSSGNRGIDFGTISSTGSGALIENNIIGKEINNNPSNYPAVGINIAGGNSHIIRNNFVTRVYMTQTTGTAAFSTTFATFGIRLAGGSGHTVIHNSVHMTGNVAGTTSTGLATAFGITTTSVSGCEVRNNIFSNQLTGGNPTGTRHACITLPSGATNTMALNLNNNAYYSGSDPNSRLGQIGFTYGTGEYLTANFIPSATSPANNLRSYTSTLEASGNNDNASFASSVMPPFVSATDLHIPAATTTKLESGGTTTSVLVDVDGQVRPGPVGSVNGGALAPDIGADEFDGIPLLLDVGLNALVSPSTSGCHGSADTVKFSLRNYSIQAIDFSVNPVTITSNATGTNPAVFTPVVLNTGTLAAASNMTVVVATSYNMSALGSYTFHAKATVVDDSNPGNDSLMPVTINISGGAAVVTDTLSCAQDPVDLTATGYTNGGTIQWQYYSQALSQWVNFAGATTNPYSALLTDSTNVFRAFICNSYASTPDSINLTTIPAATASDVTRCGPGTATLQTTLPAGADYVSWYSVPVGGNPLDTGLTFTTPFLTSSTTYYLEANGGTAPQTYSVGYINSVNYNFLTQTNGWGLMFTANMDCTFDSVGVYPTGTGTINIEILDPSNNVLYTGPTVNLSGNGTQKIMIPVGATLTPGNYKLGQNSTGISNLGSEPTGNTFAYPFVSVPATITSGTQGSGPVAAVYYWFYDLRFSVGSGCGSTRDTVTVTVTPSDTIIATAVSNPLCSNQTSVLNVNSSNAGYQYTWSPAAGLNTTTGSSVTTSSDTTITYMVSALNPSTQCAAYTNLTVTVLEAPVVNIVTPDTAICANTTLQFDVNASSHVASNATVGFGSSTNTATSTTILGPYGGVYGGARHQYLVSAFELTNAGFTAGNIDQIAFEVTALNSVPALADYTIKMGPTNLSALTISFTPSLPTVYYNSSYTPTLGWNMHDISPVYWDGTSNMIVEVCFNNNNGGTASGNASVRYTTTPTSMLYYRADNDPNVCGMLSGTVSGSRPDIRFFRSSPLSYLWTPAANLSNAAIMEPVLTAMGTGSYSIIVTDSINGCTANDNVMITVNPMPVFSIGNDTLLCENTPVTPFAIYGSDINLSYVWFDNTTGSGTVVNGPGVYYATGTNAGGCVGYDTLMVGTAPAADVDININIISPNMAELDAGSGFNSYAWSNSQTTQVATVTGNGTYWVHVIDANGCFNGDTISIVFSLGLSNPDGSSGELLFYPNPSTGLVNMAGSNITANALQLDIMDINGKVVYTRNIENPGENFLQQLDLSAVAEGTYIIRVQTENSVFSNRIIIARN